MEAGLRLSCRCFDTVETGAHAPVLIGHPAIASISLSRAVIGGLVAASLMLGIRAYCFPAIAVRSVCRRGAGPALVASGELPICRCI